MLAARAAPRRPPAGPSSPLAQPGVSGPGGGASTEGSTSSVLPDTAFPEAPRHASVRRESWRLRSGHRGLVYDLHRSLACCGLGRRPIPGEDPADASASLVTDGTRADIRGTTRCASPWACPVCAPRVAAARARVLAPQVQARMDAGWSAWLVTLTVRHGRRDDLGVLLGGLGKAWSRLTSGRWWDTFRRPGAPEYVRGLDLTWSDRHGWHPHVHVVLLLPPGHPSTAADAFAARWLESLERLGFQGLPGAQNVQECRDAGAAAAYATAPAAVYEAVGIGTKTARNPRAGQTAFDLLREAVPPHGVAPAAAVARWCEYVAAVKGRRQTTVSRGLSLDEDSVLLAVEEEPDVDTLAELGPDTLSELDRTRRGPELLEAVESARGRPVEGRQAAFLVLSGLRAWDWRILRPRPPEVARTPPPPSVPMERPPLPWAPPDGWLSPLTHGRLWRRLTREDRGILARLAKGHGVA